MRQRRMRSISMAAMSAVLLVSLVCHASDGAAVEIRTLTGHTDWVSSVAFSPDGETLASGSFGGLKLWDVATGAVIRTLSGHTDWVRSVAFNPDGETLASGSDDDTAKLWDVETGWRIRTLTGHTGCVTSVAFSPDGETLASGSDDNTIKLWGVETGKKIRTLTGHAAIVNSVAFSPDGKTLASGSDDDTAKLWDVATGQEIRTLSGHTSYVTSVAFSLDEGTLASGSWDNTIKLWDVATGQEIRTLSGHTSSVTSVAFSLDEGTLASGSWDNTIKLWDVSYLYPPRTLAVDGPSLIAEGTSASLDVSFEDSGRDVMEVWFSVIEGPSLDLLWAPHVGELAGVAKGEFSLGITPRGRGLYRVQVTLVDAAGLESEPVEFAFEACAPTPPGIGPVTFPTSIPANTAQDGSFQFKDAEGDIVEVRLMIVKGDPSTIEIDPGLCFDPEVEGETDGTIRFTVRVTQPQTVTLRSILVDAAGLESDPVEVTFEVYTPTPPGISCVTFPTSIRTNTDQDGSFQFEDAEGDIVEARFEIVEGDRATIEIDPGLSFDPEVEGETDGAIGFTVRVEQPQTVTLRLILVDAVGLESEPFDFTFDVYAPTPPGIGPVTFPRSIPASTAQDGSFEFEDVDGDIVEVRFEIVDGDPATIEIDSGLSFDPEVGDKTADAIGFTIRVMQPQTVTLRLILVDAVGLESDPVEFTFEVYAPTPPGISRVTFPGSIRANTDQNGSFQFEDAEGDITEARFEIVDGDESAIEIDPGWSFDPEIEGETDGIIRFTIRVSQAQTVSLRVTLVDAAGLESEPYEFTFTVE